LQMFVLQYRIILTSIFVLFLNNTNTLQR
jgi:hypothetical protein